MNLLLSAMLILFSGSLIALSVHSSALATRVGTLSVLVAAPMAGYVAVNVLFSGQALAFSASWSVPGGEFSLLLDPLAAFFVLPISLLSLFCAPYAGPYMAHAGQSRLWAGGMGGK